MKKITIYVMLTHSWSFPVCFNVFHDFTWRREQISIYETYGIIVLAYNGGKECSEIIFYKLLFWFAWKIKKSKHCIVNIEPYFCSVCHNCIDPITYYSRQYSLHYFSVLPLQTFWLDRKDVDPFSWWRIFYEIVLTPDSLSIIAITTL